MCIVYILYRANMSSSVFFSDYGTANARVSTERCVFVQFIPIEQVGLLLI